MVIHVELGVSSYDIELSRGALSRVGELIPMNRKVLVVTDSGVPAEYADTVASRAKEALKVVVPQGEESKSFETLQTLLASMLDAGFTRKMRLSPLAAALWATLRALPLLCICAA